MNPNYSDLEKSIYIYIKLCKYFSYDPVFYASNQRGEIAGFHEDMSRLSKIKSKEDLVVCYEFNTIYAKFLEDLKIEHRINVKSGKSYGRNHANLDFRVGEFIVFADSVTSIIGSDMVNAKLNMPLNGLKCLNKSEKTQEKFQRIVDKVYEDVSKKEEKDKSNDIYFFDLLNLYRTFSLNEKLEVSEKVKLLLDEVNATNFKTMDALGYMVKLKRIIFNKLELTRNVSMVIAQSKIDRKISPIVIITINDKENIYTSENNKYYCYTPGAKMLEYTKEEIQELFDMGDFSYLDSTRAKVPNIRAFVGRRGGKNASKTKR